MRILITNESRSASGGIETYLKALSPQLLARGHEVGWLFGHSASFGAKLVEEENRYVWDTHPETANAVRAAIEVWKPDTVYANGLHEPKWDRWLADRYPTHYFAHGYFGACISGRKCHSQGGIQVCQRSLGPSCLVLYLPRRCGGRSPIRMFRDYARERQRKRNLRMFRSILVASRYMADEYERQGVDRTRLHVVPLFPTGIEPDPEPPATVSTWTNRIVMVGRLTELKGVGLAAEAVAVAARRLNRRLSLVVVGDGPGREVLERESKKHQVALEILGWQSAEQRNGILRTADALLVPSLWPEPFGLVGIEAGCVGLPAVGFDIGGIGDWLHSETSGILLPRDSIDANQLGKGLSRLLSDREAHHRMRLGAWNVSQQFRIDRHVSRLLSLMDTAHPVSH